MPTNKSCRHPVPILLSAAILTLATLVACDGSGPEPMRESSLLPVFEGGDFTPDGWVDVPAFHRLQQERERRFAPAMLLPFDSGWSRTEAWGVYSLGERATLDLYLQDAGGREVVVDYNLPPSPKAKPIDVAVTVNDTPVEGFVAPDGDWRRARLPVPDGVLKAGHNRVVLEHSGSIVVGPHDTRELAIGVRRIGLLPTGRGFTGEVAILEDSIPPYKIDSARDALILLGTGAFVVPYEVPDAGAIWRFELQAPRWTGPGERLRVSAYDLEGNRHDLGKFSANGPFELDFDAFAGRRLIVALETQPPPGARLELRTPRALEARTPVRDPEPPAASEVRPSPGTTKSPHVLLIILDALRRDHLEAYGYGRDTAPRLADLARESAVFDNVVADCPYTLCSSPTILTGLSFARHGVTDLGMRTPEALMPLAEILGAHGYRTVGFSGNPNNSAATGGNQGFDEFYESWRIFWRDHQTRERWHPETMTDIVIGRLQDGFDGAPSFTMVHYVPPHEPYAPDPPFDVFGEPDYDRDVVRILPNAEARYSGILGLEPEDHHELVALYDGNLLQADHHVGRLFDAYRDAGLWDDTLVIVTSDHGEAFGEHGGYYGHNELLHRPMLDVPLIVRLPPSMRAADGASPARHRFTSLASVVPTVLGRLGLPVPDGVVASDLFAPEPDAAREVTIVQRSSHGDIPYYGIQTSGLKAIVRWKRAGSLFDWQVDPDESDDLSDSEPYLWTGLVSMIEAELASEAQAEEAPISEEDRKMLESLGYTG